MLAAVTDSGTTLTIQLEQDERLEISTDGLGTQFRSSNSVFSDSNLEHLTAFSGLGTDAAVLDDLSIYDTVNIESNDVNGVVTFTDSGQFVYRHNIVVDLSDTIVSGGAIGFNGSTHMGTADLMIQSNRQVYMSPDSELTTTDGEIDFEVRNRARAGSLSAVGIVLRDAVISTSGRGSISLLGEGSSSVDVSVSEPTAQGLSISGTKLESLSTDLDAGEISLIGYGGNGGQSEQGVWMFSAIIASALAPVSITGTGGTGSGSFHLGVSLAATVVESTAVGDSAGDIRIVGKSGIGTGEQRGVSLVNASRLTSVDADIFLNGNSESGTSSRGVWLDDTTIAASGIGAISVRGTTVTTGADATAGQGVLIDGNSELQTVDGSILIEGKNFSEGLSYQHGVYLSLATSIRSTTGDIHVVGNRTGMAGGKDRSVVFGGGNSATESSIDTDSGDLLIEALGASGFATLYLGGHTRIGSAQSGADITVRADEFDFQEGVAFQSNGRLAIESVNQASLTLGGEEEDFALDNTELTAFKNGFAEIAIGAQDQESSFATLNLDGAVFHDPVTLIADALVLGRGQVLTAPQSTIRGHVSIPARNRSIISGPVHLADDGSLTMFGLSAGSVLSVTDRLDIGHNVELDLEWVPLQQDQPGDQRVLVERDSGSGQFVSPPRVGERPFSYVDVFGADIEHEGGDAGNVIVTLPDRTQALPTVFDLGVDGNDGITTIYGASAWDILGEAVTSAGDVNGDGLEDLLIGAPEVDNGDLTDVGAAYLVFGSNTWPTEWSVDSDEVRTVKILGADARDFTGRMIAAGDLNADGYDDLVIPADTADGPDEQNSAAGEVTVIWGGENLPQTIELSNPGTAATVIYGADAIDRTGRFVRVIGDINNDQRPELAIAASKADGPDNSGTDVGEVHLLYGRSVWPSTIDLAMENELHSVIFGEDDHSFFGAGLVGLGDINGDQWDDFAIAATQANGAAGDRIKSGTTFVYFGSEDWDSAGDFSASDNADVVIYGAEPGDISGYRSRGKGDVTGDGIFDLVVASAQANANDGRTKIGKVVLIPGTTDWPDVIDLADPPENATVISGSESGDFFGHPAIVRDLNADGINDLAVPAVYADHPMATYGNSGETYVYLGRNQWPATIDTRNPKQIDVVILGADGADQSGTMVRSLKDRNGDGQAELVISSRYGDGPDNQRLQAGEVAIISGASLFDIQGPVASIVTSNESTTGGSLLVYDVTFDDPPVSVQLSDFQLSDRQGTTILNSSTASMQAISEAHYQITVNRRTAFGTATLAVQQSPTGTDLAGNPIDSRASSTATYVFVEVDLEVLAPSETVSGEATQFEWTKVWGANRYHYEIVRLGSKPSVWARGTTTDEHFENLVELPVGSYRAWVRSEFEGGRFGNWGSQGFRVSRSIEGLRVVDGSMSDRPTIVFGEQSGATEYEIYLSNSNTGQRIVQTKVSGSGWTPTQPLPMGRYGIWVRAYTDGGYASEWSEVVTHDVTPELMPFRATTHPEVTLQWNAVAGAATYDLYFSGGTFSSQTGLESTAYQMTVETGEYRVWVRGVTNTGVAGPWSPPIYFTGGGRTRVIEASDESGVGVPRFEWWAVDGAVDYEVYVAAEGQLQAVYRQAGITGNSFRSIPLQSGNYQVWVKSHLGDSQFVWSSSLQFTVNQPAGTIGSPSGFSPEGPILNQQTTLSWNAVEGASGYEVLLKNGPTTELITDISSTQFTPTVSLVNEETQWWVRAVGEDGQPGFFVEATRINTSGRPVLVVNPTVVPQFQWSNVINADHYLLQVDHLTTGQSVIVEAGLTESLFVATEALPAGTYRAWVRAVSAGSSVQSPWSIRVDFTIDG